MKIKVEGMPVKKSPLKCSPSDILRKNLQIQRYNNIKEEALEICVYTYILENNSKNISPLCNNLLPWGI